MLTTLVYWLHLLRLLLLAEGISFISSPSYNFELELYCRSNLSHRQHSATIWRLQPPRALKTTISTNRCLEMPSDDYASTVRGSLKLKGSKPEGIKKKKKKPKPSTDSETSKDAKSTLQQALADEDGEAGKELVKGEDGEEELDDEKLRELDPRGGDGKTASERAYEEMRRKRVCQFHLAHTRSQELTSRAIVTGQVTERGRKDTQTTCGRAEQVPFESFGTSRYVCFCTFPLAHQSGFY